MLTLHLLPALHGDALVLEYGTPDDPHRVLIDGGPRSTATREAISAVLGDAEALDLLVITHIDADHITGILSLLERRELPPQIGDVWFNGWEHLPTDKLGAKQGERLGELIARRRLPWNAAFGGKAVMVPDGGPLPEITLPGGLTLTLLSPTRAALADLRPVWKKEVEKAGLVPGKAAEEARAAPTDRLGDEALDPAALASTPFEDDKSEANGASIAFLAEYEGRSLLLTGDANDSVLTAGLRQLAKKRGVPAVKVNALKMPHHGSRYNVSANLFELTECHRFLFSTNGAIYKHPDRVAVARTVAGRSPRRLEFNYRTMYTQPWESPRLSRLFRYEMVYADRPGHLRVEI
ncbi:ComEC/Rec2 family competence protein [Micromonospora chersina]|uniref:ComEC/Rec2 family competence protein n=1 Tax=Micromonospora chersina TaxID=47854 RepID=UPI0037121846